MIEITAIRLEEGDEHQHINRLLWQSASSSGVASRQALIEWLNASGENHAVIANDSEYVRLFVVEPIQGDAYVQARARGTWRDDLLGLPQF